MKIRNALGKRQIIQQSGKYVIWSRGKGPLVVLLHGWPVSSHHWRFLVPALVAVGFETLSIDLKGLGESETNAVHFEKKGLARELLAIVVKLCPQTKRFSIVGHDWGGSVGIAMAALAPDRVSSLIIEDEIPPGIPSSLRGKSVKHYSTWHGAFHRVRRLPEKLISGNEDTYLNYFLNLRFDPKSLHQKDREHYLACYRRSEKTRTTLAYYRSFDADSRFFMTLTKRKLKIPSLAVYGEYGMGPAVADSLVQICSRVKTSEIKKSGHYPAEEKPAVFNKLILKFLRSNQL